MPIVSPFALLLLPLLVGALVFILARLPARPHSRTAIVLWVIAFLLMAIVTIYQTFFRDADVVWHPPVWQPILPALAALIIPFGTSALLWWVRRKPTSRIGVVTATAIVIAAVVLPWLALRSFNESCIYFDYHHDAGTAWCPPDWQASLGIAR